MEPPILPAEAEPGQRSLTTRTLRGVLTQVGATFGLNSLAMLRDIAFANWFTPAQYGLLDSTEIVTGFSVRFAQLGARQAVIRAGEQWRAVMRSALGLGLSLTTLIYLAMAMAAPLAARWLQNPELTLWIRWLGLTLYSSTLSLPEAAWDRQLRFGLPKLPRALGTLASVAVTAGLHFGAAQGAESLLWGAVAGFAAEHLAIWAIAPYRPLPAIEREHARAVLAFSLPLMLSGLAGYVAFEADDLMVRYFYDDATLAIYRRAFAWPFYLTKLVGITSGVLFPALVLAEGAGRRARGFVRSNRYIALLTLPAGIGMALFADPLVRQVLSEQWLPAIPLLRVFALAFTIRVSTGNNWHLLPLSRGETRPVLAISGVSAILTLALGIPLISRYGGWGGAWVNVLVAFGWALPARLVYLRRELGSLDFLRELGPPGLAAGLAALPIWWLLPPAASLLALLVQAGAYLAAYALLLRLLQPGLAAELRALGGQLDLGGRRRTAPDEGEDG
ncbi:MAG: oligosaccharide flippase family protein [Caldilineae bacterium]|nr:oligosaccharide flippase family protein [Caldilineae bacterium]